MSFHLDQHIRKVPDFPKPGILFYDVTSLMTSVEARNHIKEEMIATYRGSSINKIVAVESRGFLFAPLLADALGLPVVLARKKGKLPNASYQAEYALEYGTDVLEIQKLDLNEEDNVLIVDDLVATGGTLEAVGKMIEGEANAKVGGVFCVIGLPFLNYEKKISFPVKTLINYHSE